MRLAGVMGNRILVSDEVWSVIAVSRMARATVVQSRTAASSWREDAVPMDGGATA